MDFSLSSEHEILRESVRSFAENEIQPVAIRDVLARLEGMGDVRVFGSGDYAMRVWLKPEQLTAYGLTPADVKRCAGSVRAGVTVAKHGNKAVSSASGSAAAISRASSRAAGSSASPIGSTGTYSTTCSRIRSAP